MNPAAALTCPHLGTSHDAEAFYSYASTGNHCYHCRLPATPRLSHQEANCLSGAHTNCPVFLQAATLAFPAALRVKEPRHWRQPRANEILLVIVIGLAALGVGGLRFYPQVFGRLLVVPVTGRPTLGVMTPSVTVTTAMPMTESTSSPRLQASPSGKIGPTSAPTKTPTSTPTITPTSTPTRTLTSTPTRTLTSTPSKTPTSTPTNTPTSTPTSTPSNTPTNAATSTSLPQGRPLEAPFDIDGHKLLMHWVGGGETFEWVDARYETTTEVIRSLNYSAQTSLLANTVIVIAPGLKSVDASLPRFRVHQIEERAITIDQVAAQFNVSVALMRRYNGCTDDCLLRALDWVLIPIFQQ